MRRKGEAIGVNGQISKPEIGQLIDLIDSLVFKNNTLKPAETQAFICANP